MGKIDVCEILKEANNWLSTKKICELIEHAGYQSVAHSLKSLEKDPEIEFRIIKKPKRHRIKEYKYVEQTREDLV